MDKSLSRTRDGAVAGETGADLRVVPVAVARLAHRPATWLAALVGLSTIIRAGIGLTVPSPWILPDEVVYSELAKSIAGGARPSVRNVPVFGWGEVYPTLISPAWVLFDDLFTAYHAALVINSLVMSTAAIPAYLLARLFVSRGSSILVAAMTVLIPSMAYTAVVMTENACYPVFVLALYLVARTIRRPTIANQVLVLIGVTALAFTRIQGIALLAAYLGAIGLYPALGPRAARLAYVRRYVFTAGVVLTVPFLPVAFSVARGDGVFGWLGSRSGTFDAFHPGEIPRWLLYLAAALILYVAVAPVAATAITMGRGFSHGASERIRLFTAVGLPTIVAVLVSVAFVSASLDVDGVENLNERYVFYLVPLFFVGLALWIQDQLPRPALWAWLVAAVCVASTMLLPIDELSYNAEFQAVSLLPWVALSLSAAGLAVVVGAFAGLCGCLWLVCRRDRGGRLWLVVGLWMTISSVVAVIQMAHPAGYFARSFAGLEPSWVDRAVPDGTEVQVIWNQSRAKPSPDQFYFWLAVTEVFNKSVTDVHRIGSPTYYEVFLPTLPTSVGRNRSLQNADGRPLTAEFALVTCRTPIEGRLVAHAPRGGLRLVEVRGTVRVSTAPPCTRSLP